MAQDAKLNEVFRKSVKSYFQDKDNTNLNKTVTKRRKFTKKYFDRVEIDLFGSATVLNKKNEPVEKKSTKESPEDRMTKLKDKLATSDWDKPVQKPKNMTIKEV